MYKILAEFILVVLLLLCILFSYILGSYLFSLKHLDFKTGGINVKYENRR